MQRLSIKIQENEFVLHGNGRAAGLRGCTRQPAQRLPSGLCLEQLDLVLQGTASQTLSLITQLQTLLERVRLGHSAWLELQADGSSEIYQSRLYAGDFNWILGSVQPKGIGLRLELQRQDFWQLPWRELALTNSHGMAVTDGLQIDNRADSSGQNWCWIPAEQLQGDLPAPVRIQLHNDLNSLENLDRIIFGLGSGFTSPLPALEGELATSTLNFGAVVNANCQAGAYGLVQWNTPAAIRVLSWALPGVAFSGLAGKQLRPLVRLVNPAGLRPETWLSWKLYQGSLVFQSTAQQLSLERELQLLPMLCLPTLPNHEVPWRDLRLELIAHNRNPGTSHLAVDAVFLFFTDGWRQFAALEDGELAFGQTLIDQCDLQQPYIHLAQTQKNQHAYQVLGNGLWLLPGQEHVLQMLYDSGSSMPLSMSTLLQLEYQPRRRMLP